jgi:two-component system, sensor histidine kinase
MEEKPKILIVDDSVSNIYVIKELLAELDVIPVSAASGKEAVELTRQQEFALILMDICMPGMDGFKTVEMIKSSRENEFLNVIYITAIVYEPYYLVRGVETGAVDFITKPLIPRLFLGKVNLFLDLYRNRKSLEAEIRNRILVGDELQKAKEHAEQTALAKQQFLSVMSHEIRTPLNAIVNSCLFLREENPRNDQLENLEILNFSTQNLLVLVNQILEFSKIDAGKIEFESVEFDLRRVISGIGQSFEPEILKKGLMLNVSLSDKIPVTIQGDPTRLSQIIINLLGNAVKFTENGKVSLYVDLQNDFPGGMELSFRVSDTGIGIPEERLRMIFESFTQASSSTTRKYGGTGLGLAIARKLIELQGGRLTVDSRVNVGSAFQFSLKFLKSSGNSLPAAPSAITDMRSMKGLTVLIAEDNILNLKIVSKILSGWEVSYDVAENGKEAVQKVMKNHYHLVLMDLHMPEMNGYDASVSIRQLEGDYFKNLPIIAVTATAFSEDRSKILSHGMNGYIIKPFTPPELYSKISPFVRYSLDHP